MDHFIAIAATPIGELRHLLDVSSRLKAQLRQTGRNDPLLAGKTLAMIFEKPSLRTRVSFAVAMTQLGGNGLLLRDEEVGLGKREPVQDVARVLSGMCDGIMARTFAHDTVLGLAKWATVPVINGLTDYSHPCQAMADMLTLQEHFGELKGKTLAFIGDGNNVARSLAVACGKFGVRFILATPPGYQLPSDDVSRIMSQVPDLDFVLTHDPTEAAAVADCIYTDTWVSMGQETEKVRRLKDFQGFIIDQALLQKAPAHAVVMHCLPAYRGLEISDDVVESSRSLIFPQAENRLHFQKGLLAVLLGHA
ncbi:MAG TPA: ornithine carbamoyltransferase [Tepidisphaeraceae bacterium]|nr:ornithine carbamoyltransferase [Tepidisphaeraceae bacterium]